jgi:hypothetical protein
VGAKRRSSAQAPGLAPQDLTDDVYSERSLRYASRLRRDQKTQKIGRVIATNTTSGAKRRPDDVYRESASTFSTSSGRSDHVAAESPRQIKASELISYFKPSYEKAFPGSGNPPSCHIGHLSRLSARFCTSRAV